jgi:hypothetical protein
MSLNSENKLSYSNTGKNLCNPNQIVSLIHIGVQLFLLSMYFISHHSKIGIKKKYNNKKIHTAINNSTEYLPSIHGRAI